MQEHQCVCASVRVVSAHFCTFVLCVFFSSLLKDAISQKNEGVINQKERHADKEGYT